MPSAPSLPCFPSLPLALSFSSLPRPFSFSLLRFFSHRPTEVTAEPNGGITAHLRPHLPGAVEANRHGALLAPPSSSSSSSSDGDVLSVVGGLMGILKVSPEHQKAVQPAVDLINQQVMEIEQLREALVHVHTELSGIVDYSLHGTVPPPACGG